MNTFKNTMLFLALMSLLGACNNEEVDFDPVVIVSPNPTSGRLAIDLRLRESADVVINLYNEEGVGNAATNGATPLLDGVVNPGSDRIDADITAFEDGLYFIDIVIDNRLKRFEIIKISQ